MANRYPDIIFSTSAGNEATVDWTDHYVPVENVIEYVRMIKEGTGSPLHFVKTIFHGIINLNLLLKRWTLSPFILTLYGNIRIFTKRWNTRSRISRE